MTRRVNVQLSELVKDWPCTVSGSIRVEIAGIEDDARKVKKNYLYVARKGKKADGSQFIEEALTNGAVAIAIDEELQADLEKQQVPVIWVPNTLKFMAYGSAKLLGFPSEALTIVAVTGTNGKTTVSHFIGQILRHLGHQVMVIGTNGVFVNGEREKPELEALTTLQAKQIQKLCKEAIERKIPYIVLEASSMGLATHRLDYCAIKTGVFLNLSEEHLDDHFSFEQYKKAKQQLSNLSEQLVLNGDDTFCRSVGAISKKKKFYFGTSNRVDVQIQPLLEEQQFSTCCIQYDDCEKVVTLPVQGDYQRLNILAAITAVTSLGFSFEETIEAAQRIQLPEGRTQYIANDKGFQIVIDYAHTTEAMRAVLHMLRKQAKGKLIVVFSCGGNRDVQKRSKMGMVASTYADYIILTTDNPRSESPQRINEQIRFGFSAQQSYVEQMDRQQAIEQALEMATEGDTIAILGKGHEITQTIGNEVSYFSDLACVEQFLLNKKV